MNNRSKKLAILGVAFLSAAVLAACGNKSTNTSVDQTYSYVYGSDPKTFDYSLANISATGEVITQMVDGLMENDTYGNVVPSLAKDWKVSKDGLTYTYTLRDGISWYTADGEEYAPVTAQDFVTGLKHAVDKKSDALYIVKDSIKGLADYADGKGDFSQVGVKALDDKTVQYTLNKPEPFWNSKTTYSILFPVNEKFLKAKGDDYGKPESDSILVNGAYFLSGYTSKSSMEFTKNENYWDADNVHVNNIKLTFTDGSDPGSFYKNFDKGAFSVARLFPNDPTYKDAKKKYEDSITYGMQNSTTYFYSFNLNRTAFENSQKDASEQDSGKKALLNQDFRQAITFAYDAAAENAQVNGEEAKEKSLRNMLVPPAFVSVGNESLGEVVSKELLNYGSEWKDVDLSDAQAGLYNPTKAKEEFAKAKEALQSEGVKFPVKLDYPVDQAAPLGIQQAQSFKQSVESTLGKENVIINVIETETKTYENTGFYAESPEQQDYDLTQSGWAPDFQDLSSYLDIFRPSSGAIVQKIGLKAGEDAELAKTVGLDKYEELLDEAHANVDDLDKRNQLYAKAQAYLQDKAVIIPTISMGGAPRVSKVVPFSGSFSWTGVKGGDSYKGLQLQSEPVTVKQYNEAKEKWLKEKAKSNAEYAEKLADHIE